MELELVKGELFENSIRETTPYLANITNLFGSRNILGIP